MQNKNQAKIRAFHIISAVLLLISSAISLYQCRVDLKSLLQDPSGQDLHIFMQFVHNFKETGQMYFRPNTDTGPLADLYRPTSPVLKFPPAFALQLYPFTQQLNNSSFYFYVRIIMLIGYGAACFSLMIYTLKQWNSTSKYQIIVFLALTTTMATSSDWLRMGVFMTNYEIPIFCILTASFFSLKNCPTLSGALIGYAASVKIYPAFMMLFLSRENFKKQIFGFFLSLLFFSALAILIFGIQESYFYFTKVLPTTIKEKPANIIDNLSLAGAIMDITGNINAAGIAFLISRVAFSFTTIFLYSQHKYRQDRNLEWFSLLLTLLLINLPNYWTQYRVLLFPACCIAARRAATPTFTAMLLIMCCIATAIPDINSWSNYLANTYSPIDMQLISQNITAAYNNQHLWGAMLVIAPYSPWSVFLYFLTKMKSLVPFALWLMVSLEIIKPTRESYTTSSNPER